MPRVTRNPSHAGSWYEDDGEILASNIDKWMSSVQLGSSTPARAIIAPHAGYKYCGHVMAHAYRSIDPSNVSRIFLLGPSHHFYSRKCLLSPASAFRTPLGALELDQVVCQALHATGHFDSLDADADEAEHSLELHTPYIAWVMRGRPFKLVPIMVGALSTDGEALFGGVLAPYLDDPANLFIVSSDFCHWGTRFSYTFHEEAQGPIWKSVQWLDDLAIKAIETGLPAPFAEYMMQYKNTICGRHPIGVLLNMLELCQAQHRVEFKHYDQSSKCETRSDSSVSYAAGVVTLI